MINALTQSRLNELLHYDPDTGVFTWLAAVARSVKIGDVAGWAEDDGYLRISVGGKQYLAHRLAFLYMTGDWPKDQVDHRNGIRDDNRWDNLREATHAENGQNVALSRRNKSGFIGVCWNRQKGKWVAGIRIAGRLKHLGYFTSPEAAHVAYLAAKADLHTFQPAPRAA